MNLHRPLFRLALASLALAAPLAAQAQWAVINPISQPAGQFTITCTDYPIPSSQQVCAVTPPPSAAGGTVSGNCGGQLRLPDDPLQPNTWLYQVGPRPANPPTASCDLRVTAAPTAGAAAIPTLSEWTLILMALVAAALGLGALRHKRI